MKVVADFHTHTVYSHGKGSIRDNVLAALKKGLKKIVIADHGPGHWLYGVKKKDLYEMRKEIDELKKQFKEIEILLGVEANIISLDGDLDVDDEILSIIDILLAGFHNGAFFKTAKDWQELYFKNKLSRIIPALKQSCRITNTIAMVKAIKKNKIDIITHPGAKVDIDTKEVAKAAAEKGTLLEINSSHGFLNVDYVKVAMKENVKFVINSDAHTPYDVGNIDKGIDIAIKAGLPFDRIVNIEI